MLGCATLLQNLNGNTLNGGLGDDLIVGGGGIARAAGDARGARGRRLGPQPEAGPALPGPSLSSAHALGGLGRVAAKRVADASWSALQTRERQAVLHRWRLFVLLDPEALLVGRQLLEKGLGVLQVSDPLRVLEDVFADKATGTLRRRSGSN